MANSRSANRLLTPLKGEGEQAHLIVATPCFRSLAFVKERCSPREQKSGSGAQAQASQIFNTWPGFPRPAGVLALMEDTAVAAGLHQGPDLGVHHPAAPP